MIREELIFVATCDISGHVRGKGFPARELPGRLKKGIGWTGSNLMMSPAGPIWDTPFGTAGDLMIVPDPAAEVRVDFADGSAVEHFFLGRHLHDRRQALGVLPARFPASCRAGARGTCPDCVSSPPSSRSLSTPAPTTGRATPMRWARSAAKAISAKRLSLHCAPPAWCRTAFSLNMAPASSRSRLRRSRH